MHGDRIVSDRYTDEAKALLCCCYSDGPDDHDDYYCAAKSPYLVTRVAERAAARDAVEAFAAEAFSGTRFHEAITAIAEVWLREREEQGRG